MHTPSPLPIDLYFIVTMLFNNFGAIRLRVTPPFRSPFPLRSPPVSPFSLSPRVCVCAGVGCSSFVLDQILFSELDFIRMCVSSPMPAHQAMFAMIIIDINIDIVIEDEQAQILLPSEHMAQCHCVIKRIVNIRLQAQECWMCGEHYRHCVLSVYLCNRNTYNERSQGRICAQVPDETMAPTTQQWKQISQVS